MFKPYNLTTTALGAEIIYSMGNDSSITTIAAVYRNRLLLPKRWPKFDLPYGTSISIVDVCKEDPSGTIDRTPILRQSISTIANIDNPCWYRPSIHHDDRRFRLPFQPVKRSRKGSETKGHPNPVGNETNKPFEKGGDSLILLRIQLVIPKVLRIKLNGAGGAGSTCPPQKLKSST